MRPRIAARWHLADPTGCCRSPLHAPALWAAPAHLHRGAATLCLPLQPLKLRQTEARRLPRRHPVRRKHPWEGTTPHWRCRHRGPVLLSRRVHFHWPPRRHPRRHRHALQLTPKRGRRGHPQGYPPRLGRHGAPRGARDRRPCRQLHAELSLIERAGAQLAAVAATVSEATARWRLEARVVGVATAPPARGAAFPPWECHRRRRRGPAQRHSCHLAVLHHHLCPSHSRAHTRRHPCAA